MLPFIAIVDDHRLDERAQRQNPTCFVECDAVLSRTQSSRARSCRLSAERTRVDAHETGGCRATRNARHVGTHTRGDQTGRPFAKREGSVFKEKVKIGQKNKKKSALFLHIACTVGYSSRYCFHRMWSEECVCRILREGEKTGMSSGWEDMKKAVFWRICSEVLSITNGSLRPNGLRLLSPDLLFRS